MEDENLRIAIYETTEKIVEGGYGDFYNTIKRKTAIEKMARAMIEFDKNRNKDYPTDPYKVSEAALKALLEE